MLKIHIFAPINPTGVGTHAQFLLNELVDRAKDGVIELQITPVGLVSYSAKRSIQASISDHMMRKNHLSGTPDVTIVLDTPRKCNQWLEDNKDYPCGMRVAYTVFELEPLRLEKKGPKTDDYFRELHCLSYFDQTWVPSAWAKGILEDIVRLARVHVVREGIAEYGIATKESDDNIVFGNIGKFEMRKGHHQLIEAMRILDQNMEYKTTLVGWWHNFWDKYAHAEWLTNKGQFTRQTTGPGGEVYVGKNGYSTIVLPSREAWQEDCVRSWSRVDCMVFPTYAEGWGLPIGEAIGLGIPTLSTCVTGHAEFVDMYLNMVRSNYAVNNQIATSGVPCLAEDDRFFKGQGKWDPVLTDSIITKMQEVINRTGNQTNRDQYKAIAKIMKREFSWKKSADQLLMLLGISSF